MATTPHSSWNLSNMVLQSMLPGGANCRDIPCGHQVTPPRHLDSPFYGNAHYRGFDAVSVGDLRYPFGMSRRKEDARRSFMEQQQFRPERRIQVDARAHARMPERAFRQSDRETSVAQVVRRLDKSGIHDFA